MRAPHDAEFYKILDTLWNELEEYMSKSTGLPFGFESFTGTGQRLGHDSMVKRNRNLLATERRTAAYGLINAPIFAQGEGRKLGESNAPAHIDSESWTLAKSFCSPREMAALAAMRRAQDAVWCGNASSEFTRNTKNRVQSKTSVSAKPIIDITDNIDVDLYPIMSNWTCSVCTLVNFSNAATCVCCESLKPPGINSTMTKQQWTCPRCTLINSSSFSRCQACDLCLK